MSSASPAHPGQPSLGSLASKILIIVVIWAALVFATMHFVGNVWPKAYQVNLAEADAAKLKAEEATNPPKPEAPVVAPATASGAAATAMAPVAAKAAPATPAASTPAPAASAPASSAPAAGTAASASAASAPTAGTAAPAASAPKATGEQKLPHDPSLAGYNRSALWNVAVFYSIVISTLCVGAIILQLFKYFHREEEEAAH